MSHRILIVDDQAVVRRVLRKKLAAYGYEIAEAANGKEAIERLGEETVDLVITDILMPEVDGLETIIHLRSEHPRIKTIVITAPGNEAHVDSARRLGASRIFLKPFKLEDLAAAVEELLCD